MYRESRGTPIWLITIVGMMLVFGGYYTWRGLIAFFESGGNIAAPVIDETATVAYEKTATAVATIMAVPFDFLLPTKTSSRICQDYHVSVSVARVRECPDQACATLDRPVQNTEICVYKVVKDAPDWFEIDLAPAASQPQLAYMHNSVLKAGKPARAVTRTFTPVPFTLTPSVTPVPLSPIPFSTVTPLPQGAPTSPGVHSAGNLPPEYLS